MPAEFITLQGSSGDTGAYESRPEGPARGGIVLLQELFGVNEHIRSVADGYAAAGYHVIAPALFDRAERDVQLGYDDAAMERGRALRATISWEQALSDIEAARARIDPALPVATLGYCWGGAIAWLAACRLSGLSASVSYYGGGIGGLLDEKPRCPVLCHFGERDHVIPLADVQRLKDLHADKVEVHIYPAGHGFNCDVRPSHDAQSAALARERTLRFLEAHLG